MSVFLEITFSGIALGALYAVVASGLSLIYGLMEVLNFAHGLFLTLGAYAGWAVATYLPGGVGMWWRLVISIAAALAAGAVVGFITETGLIRRLYGRPTSQILVTIGLDLALVGILEGWLSNNSRSVPVPSWLLAATHVGSLDLPNGDFLVLGASAVVLLGLVAFLERTRYGLIIRAGAENREMVSALGVNVGRAFTLVFAIGGAAAGLAGLLNSICFSGTLVSPTEGDTLLIFAFIVVIIGGLGSLLGAAIAGLAVGLLQDYVGYYLGSHPGLAEMGNLSVVLLLVLVLELRPRGLFGRHVLAAT